VGAARRAKAAGWVLHVVTARRGERAIRSTEPWLKRHGVPFDFLEFVSAEEKAGYCIEHDIELGFEDSPKTALQMSEVCPVFLVATGYNRLQENELHPLVIRKHRHEFCRFPYTRRLYSLLDKEFQQHFSGIGRDSAKQSIRRAY
jgi:hypothetical protein